MSQLKYTTLRLTDEDKEYLRLKYGTVQNAFRSMVQKDKEDSIRLDKEVKALRQRIESENVTTNYTNDDKEDR